MRKVLLAISLGLMPASAFAQPGPDEDLRRSLPAPAEVEAMTGALDRMVGALLNVDVRPIVQAVDPAHPALRRGERTLRDMAERDDPYFEERMRGTLHGVSGQMNRVMDAVVAVTPVLRQSLEQIERSVEDAVANPPPRAPLRD